MWAVARCPTTVYTITSTMWPVATRNSEPSFELRVSLNAMLEVVKFPGSIADVNTGLTDVDRNALSHFREGDNIVAFNVFLFFRGGGV